MNSFFNIISAGNFAMAALFFCLFLVNKEQNRRLAAVVDLLFIVINIFAGLCLRGIQ